MLGLLLKNPAMASALLSPQSAQAITPVARQLLDNFAKSGAPDDVVSSGRAFLDALDRWIAEKDVNVHG
jgi:hypothetical protein